MSGLGIAVSFLLLLWCSLLFVPFRWRPVGIYLFPEKVIAVAFTPFIAVVATILALVGAVYRSWWIAVPAGLAAAGAIVVVVRVSIARVDLTGVLGAGWEDRIPSRLRRQMVRRWRAGPIPKSPEPRLRQDVALPGGRSRLVIARMLAVLKRNIERAEARATPVLAPTPPAERR